MRRLFLTVAALAAMAVSVQARQDAREGKSGLAVRVQTGQMTAEDQIRYYNSILSLDTTVPGISRAEAERGAVRIAETVEDTDRQSHYIFATAIADSVGTEKLKQMQEQGQQK